LVGDVQRVLKRSGGWIDVESEIEKGTKFKLHFPVAAMKKAGAPTPIKGNPPPRTKDKKTILLAEDNPHIQEALARMLTSKGYTVLTAGDGMKQKK